MEEALLAGGVPEEDIQRAAHIGGLELLAIDRLLDEAPRNLSQRDIATEAGLPVEDVSRVWRAIRPIRRSTRPCRRYHSARAEPGSRWR